MNKYCYPYGGLEPKQLDVSKVNYYLSFWFLAAPVNLTAEEIEEKWQELASDLSATLQGHAGEIPDSTIPFDAASEVPVDEQKWVTEDQRHLMTHFQS